MALTDPNVQLGSDELAIRLSFDKDARTITVSDNGIGMTEEELDRNLGTIAHSGSEAFKEANAEHQGEDIDIIGQFGVGFYSTFMVADHVRVISRAYGSDQAFVWESDGIKGYTVSPAGPGERDGENDHGTDVILYLREIEGEDSPDKYLSEWGLRDLVRRYSNYVRHPVQMMVSKSRELPKPEDAGDDYTPEYETYQELETLNSMTPIWKKRSSDVEQSDYDEFYTSTFHDWEKPARTISFHAEGALSYDALLFVPSRAPFDLYSKVVDSPDVTLNISRETLQHNSQLRAIERRVERKVHDELTAMMRDDREAYEKFFENFGRGLKFGIYNSYGASASDLADLLLFWSAREDKMVSFAEYVAAMPESQDKIYYAAGDSRERLEKTPVVKSAVDHGFDVLLCTQDVDEFMFQAMRTYHAAAVAGDSEHKGTDERDLELTNVSTADLDFATEEEKAEAEKASEEHASLFDAMKDALGEKVVAVRASARAGEAPACIATEGPISLEMERIISEGPDAGMVPGARRVLELNASHPVFAKLVAAQDAGDEAKLSLYASLLYDQALLVEGLPVDDPVEFAKNVCELM